MENNNVLKCLHHNVNIYNVKSHKYVKKMDSENEFLIFMLFSCKIILKKKKDLRRRCWT